MTNLSEYYIRIFLNRSELVSPDGNEETFLEGVNNQATKDRYKLIVKALSDGFLKEQIRICREEPENVLSDSLEDSDMELFDVLVSSTTSEVGRALIGLSVLQLTIKSIEPSQSIRLHKGGASANSFGWKDGISMRSLDKNYITPVLRKEGLVKLNADGFMMTRSLAENYPYTKVYKAAIRGARQQWLNLVERLEVDTPVLPSLEPLPALHYFLSKLLNHADNFNKLAIDVLDILDLLIVNNKFDTIYQVKSILNRHIYEADYSARIMEISMHSFMQAIEEVGGFGSASLVSLSQMRSANKKHGNIGDIELIDNNEIIVSWDAKYGKIYLRDELEELKDKLPLHSSVIEAGFVTSENPSNLPEIVQRISDLEDFFNIKICILSLDDWIEKYFRQVVDDFGVDELDISNRWIRAYVESIAQRRHEKAPIDEPCYEWLDSFKSILQNLI